MKKLQKFLSLILVLLLVTSCYVPAVSASPSFIDFVTPPAPHGLFAFLLPFLPMAVPEMTEIIIGGVTVVITGAAALKIAENLGMKWDETQKGWDRMMMDTGAS